MIKKVIGFCILSTVLIGCDQGPQSQNISPNDKVAVSPSGNPAPPNPMQVGPTTPVMPLDYKESLAKLPKVVTDNPGFGSCLAQQVNMCANNAINNLAMNADDTDICNEIVDENMKGTCKSIIQTSLATKRDNEGLCAGIPTEIQCRQNVIVNRAIAKADPKICESLRSKSPSPSSASGMTMPPVMDFADNCIMRSVMSSASPELEMCESILDVNTKTMCEQSVKSRTDMIRRQSASSTGDMMNGPTPSFPTTPTR